MDQQFEYEDVKNLPPNQVDRGGGTKVDASPGFHYVTSCTTL
jgi:hypothetical protein